MNTNMNQLRRGMLVKQVLALVLVLYPSALAQTSEWVIDSENSSLAYTGSHPLHSWTGTSSSLSGSLTIDIADPTGGAFEIRVPIESFDSGNSNRDSNMMEVVEVWLWPEVVFVSESLNVEQWSGLESGGEGAWLVDGFISFHGEKRPVVLSADVTIDGDTIEATSSFVIELDAFKIDRPKLMLKRIRNELQVEGRLFFRREGG